MQGQARCIFSWSKRGLLIPTLLEIPAISVLGNQGERSIKLHLARGLIFETGKFTCLLLASQKLLWRQLVIIKKKKAAPAAVWTWLKFVTKDANIYPAAAGTEYCLFFSGAPRRPQ